MLTISLEKVHCPAKITWQGQVLELGALLSSGAFASVREVKTTGAASNPPSAMVAKVVEAKNAGHEASILSTTCHPHIIRFFGCVHVNHWDVLLLELAQGGELFHRVQQMEHGLDERLAARWTQELLSAVEHCHSLGIVHRDIKPENVLLASDGPDAALRLADFGSAKKIDATVRGDHTPCGSAAYAAPEAIRTVGGNRSLASQYDCGVDVWSCGVLTYVLLTGRLPTFRQTVLAMSESVQPALATREGAAHRVDLAYPASAHAAIDSVGMRGLADGAGATKHGKCPSPKHAKRQGGGSVLRIDDELREEISSSALAFLCAMLQPHSRRPAATQARQHEWLRGASPPAPADSVAAAGTAVGRTDGCVEGTCALAQQAKLLLTPTRLRERPIGHLASLDLHALSATDGWRLEDRTPPGGESDETIDEASRAPYTPPPELRLPQPMETPRNDHRRRTAVGHDGFGPANPFDASHSAVKRRQLSGEGFVTDLRSLRRKNSEERPDSALLADAAPSAAPATAPSLLPAPPSSPTTSSAFALTFGGGALRALPSACSARGGTRPLPGWAIDREAGRADAYPVRRTSVEGAAERKTASWPASVPPARGGLPWCWRKDDDFPIGRTPLTVETCYGADPPTVGEKTAPVSDSEAAEPHGPPLELGYGSRLELGRHGVPCEHAAVQPESLLRRNGRPLSHPIRRPNSISSGLDELGLASERPSAEST